MKGLLIVSIILGVFAGGSAQTPKIDSLGWMAGCWESNEAEIKIVISEQWMKPAGGMMIGTGRTVRDGKTIDYEFVRIVEEPKGIFYIAKPKANKDETRFKLIKSTANEIVFENPVHDFPQRVMYGLNGNILTGRIEGTQNGKLRGIDFPMSRVKCE